MMWGALSWYAHHEGLWWLVLLSVASLLMGVFAREARGSARESGVSTVAVVTCGDLPLKHQNADESWPASLVAATPAAITACHEVVWCLR
jgi:hypothetical protein